MYDILDKTKLGLVPGLTRSSTSSILPEYVEEVCHPIAGKPKHTGYDQNLNPLWVLQ